MCLHFHEYMYMYLHFEIVDTCNRKIFAKAASGLNRIKFYFDRNRLNKNFLDGIIIGNTYYLPIFSEL